MIYVLLILAGISISMLSGDNGLLNRTTEARERTIHANVFEQLQLEELAYLTNKATSRDTSTLIGYLQTKSIIGNEIGEDTGKYQVNVTVLLGSKQSLGNGDATSELKDVYMLEKQNVSLLRGRLFLCRRIYRLCRLSPRRRSFYLKSAIQ